METGQSSQLVPTSRILQPDEGDEGGLNLGQLVAALRRKLFLIVGVTTVVAAAAAIKALTDTPTYAARFELLTHSVTVESEVTSTIPDTLSSQDSSDMVVDDTTLRVLLSPKVLDPIVEELKTQYPNLSYIQLFRNLTVKNISKDFSILEVSYTDADPQLVKRVLELVAEAYLEYSLESRQLNVRQGIEFVETQLPEQRERVNDLQEQLQQLRLDYDLIDPESLGTQLSSQLSSFAQQQLEVRVQLRQTQSLYADLQNQLVRLPSEAVASSVLTTDSRYQSLLNQLLEIDSQIAKDSALFLEGSPNIQILRDQRQNLVPLLLQEGERVQNDLAGQIRELEERDRALTQTINDLNARVKDLSGISRQYTDIQRELDIATQNLSEFLSKREALRIDAAQREIPWELLTPPSRPLPSVSSIPQNLILGAVLGLLLGIGSALVLDRLSNVLHTTREIKNIVKVPILGVIPFNKAFEDNDTPPALSVATWLRTSYGVGSAGNNGRGTSYEFIPFLESFRSLFTNIRLLSADHPVRMIAISSATPSEGKSTVSVNLAQAAAAMGKRVLLVDTDLRRPQIHHRLSLSNEKGLTQVIATDLDLHDAIQRSLLEENLYILTSGPIPPDPTKLLSSQKMTEIIAKSLESFDFIIFDTPPLLGFADAYLMSAAANGLILVAGLGKLKRSFLEQALEDLRVSSTPVLGVVANGAKDKSFVDTYHSYYQLFQDDEPYEEEVEEESSGLKSLIPAFFKKIKLR
jgi:capsular exopolysaccharide synthesis family protein